MGSGLSPILFFSLALIVAGGGMAIRLLLDPTHEAEVYKSLKIWAIQALGVFPICAWLATVIVGPLFLRLPNARLKRTLLQMALIAVHYMLIAIASVTIFRFIISDRPGSLMDWIGFLFMMVDQATAEFSIFALLFVPLHIFSSQIGRLLPLKPLKSKVPMVAPVLLSITTISVAFGLISKSPEEIKDELHGEFIRTGVILENTDDVHVGEAIKKLEEKYGLPLTGEPSKQLLGRLAKESTKLVYTVGGKDADASELSSICTHISGYKWPAIRKKQGISEAEVMAFEIRIDQHAKVGSGCRFGGLHKKIVSIHPVSDEPAATLKIDRPVFFSEGDESGSKLEVRGIEFDFINSAASIDVNDQVSMRENFFRGIENSSTIALTIKNKQSFASEIADNQFINATVSVNGNTIISGNRFTGPAASIEVHEGSPSIGTNHFRATERSLLIATGSSHPKISGKVYLDSASKWPLISAKDQASINFIDGSVAAPLAAGCLHAMGTAKLIVNNVRIGPCGLNYWSLALDEQATAEMRNVRFDRAGGDLRAQINKPLEDSVLVLENTGVGD